MNEKFLGEPHDAGYIDIKWETPQPKNNVELPSSYNIYRSKENNFVAVDLTSWLSDGYYCSIKSIGTLCEISAVSPLVGYK